MIKKLYLQWEGGTFISNIAGNDMTLDWKHPIAWSHFLLLADFHLLLNWKLEIQVPYLDLWTKYPHSNLNNAGPVSYRKLSHALQLYWCCVVHFIAQHIWNQMLRLNDLPHPSVSIIGVGSGGVRYLHSRSMEWSCANLHLMIWAFSLVILTHRKHNTKVDFYDIFIYH